MFLGMGPWFVVFVPNVPSFVALILLPILMSSLFVKLSPLSFILLIPIVLWQL
jgi:hypothetical protein